MMNELETRAAIRQQDELETRKQKLREKLDERIAIGNITGKQLTTIQIISELEEIDKLE